VPSTLTTFLQMGPRGIFGYLFGDFYSGLDECAFILDPSLKVMSPFNGLSTPPFQHATFFCVFPLFREFLKEVETPSDWKLCMSGFSIFFSFPPRVIPSLRLLTEKASVLAIELASNASFFALVLYF